MYDYGNLTELPWFTFACSVSGEKKMDAKKLLQSVRENLDGIIDNKSLEASTLWNQFLLIHPADMADFFADIDRNSFKLLFPRLPEKIKLEVFDEFSDIMRVQCLSFMHEQDQIAALNSLPADELTDIFGVSSDQELQTYLRLLHKKPRKDVLDLMKFAPDCAGGIMDINALTLMEDFTVANSIQLLQRLHKTSVIDPLLYVTDRNHVLVGHIKLEDLVLHSLHSEQTRIAKLMRPNPYVAKVNEDQEVIAKQMVHYGLMTVPVVGTNGHFLGIIPSETLVDVLVAEASEDLQKMSALIPMRGTYFEASVWRVIIDRGVILVILLIAQSFSAKIMQSYESTLQIGSLWLFVTTLISAGGNSSNQTSAVAIQGLATGEIRSSNVWRFFKREMLIAVLLSFILGLVGFLRSYMTSSHLVESCIVGFSLVIIVIVAVGLGSLIPLILKRLKIDPAFSAGPFLATLMDLLGVFIFCMVSRMVLGS